MTLKNLHELHALVDEVMLARGAQVKKLTGVDVSDLLKHGHSQREVADQVRYSRAVLQPASAEIRRLTTRRKEELQGLKKKVKGAMGRHPDTNAYYAADGPERVAKRIAEGRRHTMQKAQYNADFRKQWS